VGKMVGRMQKGDKKERNELWGGGNGESKKKKKLNRKETTKEREKIFI